MTGTSQASGFGALRDEFHKVLELPDAAREACLERLRDSDAPLHAQLQELLLHVSEEDLLPPDTPTPTSARIVGPFRLLRSIGRGGMGEVYLAERCSGGFEQRVALKLVRFGGLSQALNERFLRERQLLARLSHPNIARLIDGGLGDDGQPWLAMELVEGERITEWAQSHQLDLRAKVTLLRRVAAAVAFAHSNLIVHRDIKPANILVGADGEPKLLDFGIAKLLDDSESDATQTGARALTVRYAAPEQIGGESTTTATDVYALGVLLFELLSGHSPYAAAESGRCSWSQSVISETAQPLNQAARGAGLGGRLQGDIDRIVQKALMKSAQERYPSVVALSDDLADWLEDRPLRSGIGGTRERSRQLLKQYRWPLTLAASVILALAAGLLLALREARVAERQTRIAQANLSAMLGVLGGANRRDYRGSEPPASEFLVMAAQRLRRDFGDDPGLIHQSLGEIGHGLINLGHGIEAEPVLVAALEATERMPGADADARLGLYKLLVLTQDAPGARLRAEDSATRIAALAPNASVDTALDALSTAAGVLSKHGLFELSSKIYVVADGLMTGAPLLRASAAENFWRQRGWVAWRAFELDTAADCLHRSAALMQAHPAEFSDLRRAETQVLLGEVEITRGNAAAAQIHLDAAWPAIEQEYAEGHSERAMIRWQQARLALLRGRHAVALSEVDEALRVLEQRDESVAASRTGALWTRAESLAGLGRCTDAIAATLAARRLSAMSTASVVMPREIQLAAASERAVNQGCQDGAGQSAIAP